MKLLERIKARFAESAWAPLAAKMGFGAVALLVLGIVGSGALDHLFASRAAHASDAARPRPALAGSADPAKAIPALLPAFSASPPASASAPSPAPAPSGSSESPRPDGRIVLNTATQSELEKLPGIGPNKAKKILELREKLGRFKRLEDLYRIKGIKRRLLEKMRPLVVLDAEERPPAP